MGRGTRRSASRTKPVRAAFRLAAVLLTAILASRGLPLCVLDPAPAARAASQGPGPCIVALQVCDGEGSGGPLSQDEARLVEPPAPLLCASGVSAPAPEPPGFTPQHSPQGVFRPPRTLPPT
jgi:hypothetical protein